MLFSYKRRMVLSVEEDALEIHGLGNKTALGQWQDWSLWIVILEL